MKRRSSSIALIVASMASLLVLAFMSPHAVAADTSAPPSMRLLRHEGDVEIEDASGKPRAVAEDTPLYSGDSLKTAKASFASVVLDEGRVITLDEKSQVEFRKEDGAVAIDVNEGGVFLDVSKKLGSDETMDIKVSGVTVGIRGTIVFIERMPATDDAAAGTGPADLKGLSPEKGHIVSISQIGVLEGTAQITYTDNSNRQQTVAVEAGKKATVPEYSEDAEGIPEPKVSDLTKEDIEGFVKDQVASSASIVDRVQEACDVADDIDISNLAGIYTADGDWTWDSPVTLVAQSASKYYDGQPLTRSSDILVNGLPSIFTVKASAGGSRTDAGESDNPVSDYAIYNKAGQDVTRHFTRIETVSGTLLVVPASLTIHTGAAEKVYDGTVLTEPDAHVTFYKGSDSREVPWRNTSYAVTEPAENASHDKQTLYGICGVIWVNAANPLTGERREIQLKAGQKLTILISDLAGRQGIELKTERLTENDLPDELLRLYADNPALLQQACKDTGWNIELLKARIEALPKAPSSTAVIEQGGLIIRESESDRLMQNLINVRITIDTEVTDYNNRALGSEEACFTSLAVDESIKVTATGRQTNVGASTNTYTIDWGTVDRSNYEVSEDLGALTVTPAPAAVTTGSAEKVYDGTPLTNSEASISGLVNGETATVRATGSLTEVGTSINTYVIDWNSADPSNYAVFESLGTLRVTAAAPTPPPAPYGSVTLTAASAEKTYDGTPLTDGSFTAEGLPSGFSVSATVSGSQTDAGSSDNGIDSYTIFDADGSDVTSQFPNVTTQSGTLKVTPANVSITTGSVEKVYSGNPLTCSEASISGLVNGETATVRATGSLTEVGSTENTYSISWGTADRSNYEVSEELGTLTVTPAPAAVTTGSAEKVYDGSPLTCSEASISGLVNGETATVRATGSLTEVGTTENTYSISWGTAKSSNYVVSESLGTLTVTRPEVAITLTAASAEKTYDGTPLTDGSFTAEGLPSGFSVSATVSGSQTDAGSSDNGIDSYTIFDADGSDVTSQFPNVTTQSGTLVVKPLPVEFDLCFLVEEGEDGAVFEYDGSPCFPEWIVASYQGSDAVDPDDWNTDGEGAGAYSFTFNLPGGAKLQLSGEGYTDAGSYTFEPKATFLAGKTGNYEITFTNNAIQITPAPLTITASASKEYDGRPLNGSDAVEVEGLAERDGITVTATGTITDAGMADNPYTIDWGDTNPDNYTVTEEPGTLEVTAKKVTLTTGSDDKVYDGDALYYSSYELTPSDPWVSGQAPTITVTGSITNAGTISNTCMIEWKGVNPNNYEVTEKLGTLTVKPIEVILTQDCEYDITEKLTIAEYGLKVQVNNVDSSHHEVTQMDENRWWLQFDWGDKIEARIAVDTNQTLYTITPVYDFVSGDSGNYSITTIDVTGEFITSPFTPIDGLGMGKPSTLSSPPKRSLPGRPETIEATAADDDVDNGHSDIEHPSSASDGEAGADEGDTQSPDEQASHESNPEEAAQEEPAEVVQETSDGEAGTDEGDTQSSDGEADADGGDTQSSDEPAAHDSIPTEEVQDEPIEGTQEQPMEVEAPSLPTEEETPGESQEDTSDKDEDREGDA